MEEFLFSLIKTSFIVSLVILLVTCITPFLQKIYSNKWRYWLWLVLSIMLIVPLNIALPNTPITINLSSMEQSVVTPTQQQSIVPKLNTGQENTSALQKAISPPQEKQYASLTFIELALVIWALGTCLFLLWHILSYYWYKRVIERWQHPVQDVKIIKMFNQIQSELNLRSMVQIKMCSKVNSPMLMGLWRPVILLPTVPLTHDQLKHVIEHELTHYKSHDIPYKMLLLIAKSLHWFNPCIHLMCKMASTDIEKCCDARVVQRHNRGYAQAYVETIIAVMKLHINRDIMLSTHFKEGKKTMMSRLKVLLEPKKHRHGLMVLSLMVLVVFIIYSMIGYSQKNEDTMNSGNELVEVLDEDMIAFIEEEKTPLGEPKIMEKLYDGLLAIIYWEGDDWFKYYEVYKYKNGKITSRWLNGYGEHGSKYPFSKNGGTASGDYPYAIIRCHDDAVVLSYDTMHIHGELGDYTIHEKGKELYIVPTGRIGSIKSITAMGSSVINEGKIMEYDFDSRNIINKPNTVLPPFEKQTNDKIERLTYQAALANIKWHNEKDICIIAPKIFGSFEVDGQLKIFATIYGVTYSLEEDVLMENGGWNIPTAMIYKLNADGTYTLEDYILAKDGSYYSPSIKEFTAPHDDIAKEMIDTQDYIDEQQQLMMDNVKAYVEGNKHLNIRYVKDNRGKILLEFKE
ncbi:M56 family metallopeptidase [Vallitalea pronyensis]|uniref:M56 family metallopeptidase n=1 Tax=Vallitalea pronyensis TaxID=1348613 RepID=A0A8J8MK13_9FIRM|nr:M56 family metallopeptidase [Vallitalea pronyensis]QUI22837.1 M56 family metallopeptidase [Vallitalea pronyensis]